MKRWGRYLVILIVLGCLGAGGTYWIQGTPKADAAGDVTKVTRGTVSLSVQEVGTVAPMRKIEIKSKVSGQVTEVLVDVGHVVKAGAPLIQLDALDARRELELAQARLKVSEARLHQAEDTMAFKSHAHAQGNLAQMELSAAEGEVKHLSALAEVERAQVQQLRDRVGYTVLKAPIDGVVLVRNVQPGEMVTPGTAAMADGKPLLVVAQVDELLVRTELNQIDVTRLDKGDKVEVRVDALGDKVFRGEVYRIAAMAQKSERKAESTLQVFPVDVLVKRDQPGAEALRPGMIADLFIDVAAHENVLTVPLEALVREQGKTRLRKLVAGAEEKLVDVSVGFQNERVVEITSGVKEGESIRVLPADANAQIAD
jgi:HlyD family secretion protein